MSQQNQTLIQIVQELSKDAVKTPARKALTVAILVGAVYGIKQIQGSQALAEDESKKSSQKYIKAKKVRGNVDREFINRVVKLFKQLVPSWRNKEVGYIVGLGFLVILRTMMSIWLADVNGRVVKAIVNKDIKMFAKRIFILFLFAIPSSTVNSALEYGQKQLALSFRERLTGHFHEQYMRNMHYYKICNLDHRISNPDQILTNDAEKWATSLSSLYLNTSKPILDVVLFARKLTELVGWQGPALAFGYYGLSAIVLRNISPAFGKLTAQQQQLEGEYRALHTQLLAHSEEISFYNGAEWERINIDRGFDKLFKHIDSVITKKFWMEIFDSMLTKYGAVMVGYTICGLPVFGPGSAAYLAKRGDSSQITKDYVRNSSLLINLSKAIGKMVISYKEIQSLAGYTTLIDQMNDVLADLSEGKYKKILMTRDKEGARGVLEEKTLSTDGTAVKVTGNKIVFKDVPIVSPNKEVLVKKMSFDIEEGMHVMVTGPNGCGKSSLSRILADLWPAESGYVMKPKPEDMYYIPQRPYLPMGTLRDQIIYPDSVEQMKAKGYTDEKLQEILEIVRLAYIPGREGGYDSQRVWFDVLSGGEKQRTAFARLIYHKPKFVILDECTSAVSSDVEGHLYTHLKSMNITMITVSHRDTLWGYHDYMLKFVSKNDDTTYDFKFYDMKEALAELKAQQEASEKAQAESVQKAKEVKSQNDGLLLVCDDEAVNFAKDLEI